MNWMQDVPLYEVAAGSAGMIRMDRETSSKSSVMKKNSELEFEAGDPVSKVL